MVGIQQPLLKDLGRKLSGNVDLATAGSQDRQKELRVKVARCVVIKLFWLGLMI